VDLGRLSELDRVLAGVAAQTVDPAEGSRRVDAILAHPPRYGAVSLTLAFMVASGGAARFFGGGWREVAAALLIGLLTGLLAAWTARPGWTGRIFEPLAATVAAFVAVGAAALTHPVSPYVATLGGLIVLLPGLTLTVAINELATRHLVSGSVRLIGACALFLMIGFGVALGTRAAGFLFGLQGTVDPAPLPGWTEWLALVTAPFAFTVLFQAEARDAGWIFLAGMVAYLGARFGARLLGPELGVFLGSFLVGTASNLFARLKDRPASVMLVPGIMFLVPGAIGFRSLSSLIARDVVSGVETAFLVTLVAAALVTGLLLANVAASPRRAL